MILDDLIILEMTMSFVSKKFFSFGILFITCLISLGDRKVIEIFGIFYNVTSFFFFV